MGEFRAWGVRAKLEIRATPAKGWGVHTQDAILQGDPIAECEHAPRARLPLDPLGTLFLSTLCAGPGAAAGPRRAGNGRRQS